MNDYGLEPTPPQWALSAGLPHPFEDETFIQYVTRMGFSAKELLVDLSERTIVLANYRLATKLQRSMPYYFNEHIEKLCQEHIPQERLEEIKRTASSLWGDRYRRPVAVA